MAATPLTPYEVSDQALLLVCLRRASRAGLIDAEHTASLKDLILCARPMLIAAARAYRETKDDEDLLDSLLLVAGLPPVPSPSAISVPAPLSRPAFTPQSKITAVPIVNNSGPISSFAGSFNANNASPKPPIHDVHSPSWKPTTSLEGTLHTITAMDAYRNVSLEELRSSSRTTSSFPATATASVASTAPSRVPFSPPNTAALTARPFKARPESTISKLVAEAREKSISDASVPAELKVQVTFKDMVPHVKFRIGVLGPTQSGKSALIALLVDGVSAHQRPVATATNTAAPRSLQLHTNVGVLSYELHEGRAVPAVALHGAILVAPANAPIDVSLAYLASLRATLPPQCAVYVALTRSDEVSMPLKQAALAKLVAGTAPSLGAAVLSARTGLNAERPLLYISRALCGFPLLTFEPQPAPLPERTEPAAPRYVW